jgi:hypothetical protein
VITMPCQPGTRGAGEVVVFLGPSLPERNARELVDATFLPPADRGAVHGALFRNPQVIVLLDGVFHGSPSVWPRELLDAIEDGITVIGAASMGALRAVELAPFGMIGCGQVYRWYRDGVIEADDEVALLHSDEESGYRALSEPLVNIRATLSAAARAGCLTGPRAAELVEYARLLHYPDRCWPGLLNSAITARWPAEVTSALAAFVSIGRRDVKRADARTALRLAARLRASGPLPREVAAVPSSAHGLRRSARTFHGTVPSLTGPTLATEMFRRAGAERPELMRRLRERVVRRFFVCEWARLHDVSCSPAELAGFARGRALRYRPDPPRGWLRDNGLTPASYARLFTERAHADWVTHLNHSLSTAGAFASGVPVADQLVVAWALGCGVITQTPGTAGELIEASRSIVTNGPAHFGLPFNEGQALIEELQMTGAAAELSGTTEKAEIA